VAPPERRHQLQLSITSQVGDFVVSDRVILVLLLPEGQVLLEELDDALGVAEVVLLQLVNLVQGALQGVVGKLAGLGVVLQHLVVEDGEVQSQTELDGVAGGQRDLVSLLVGLLSFCLNRLELVALGVFGNVAVVVTNHLDEEGSGLGVATFLI